MKDPLAPATSYSFEQILGWFGRFTPQFKFRLLALRRQLDTHQFDTFVREAMSVFRAALIELGRSPQGADRARKVFALMDQEFQVSPVTGVSCAAGCGACCRNFPKQITSDEADLLSALVTSGQIDIDRTELARQTQLEPGAKSSCLFLSEAGECRVYADRPGVCRKYHVVSPAANCASDTEPVVPRIDLMPELIVSAAMSLPGNDIDFMPQQLARRLSPAAPATDASADRSDLVQP